MSDRWHRLSLCLRKSWGIVRELLEMLITDNARWPSADSGQRSQGFKCYSGSLTEIWRGLLIPTSAPKRHKLIRQGPNLMSRLMEPTSEAISMLTPMMPAWSTAGRNTSHPMGQVLRWQEKWPTVQPLTAQASTSVQVSTSRSKEAPVAVVMWMEHRMQLAMGPRITCLLDMETTCKSQHQGSRQKEMLRTQEDKWYHHQEEEIWLHHHQEDMWFHRHQED